MAQHTTFCHGEKERLAQKCRSQIRLAEKYKKYRERSSGMLSEFESKRDEHLGTITTTKRRIEPVDPSTTPVHSAPYRAG